MKTSESTMQVVGDNVLEGVGRNSYQTPETVRHARGATIILRHPNDSVLMPQIKHNAFEFGRILWNT